MSDIKVNTSSDNESNLLLEVELNSAEESSVAELSSDDERSSSVIERSDHMIADRRKKGAKFWTPSKSLKLIRLYRSKTCLWSTKDPNHYKSYMKQKMWIDIARSVGQPVEACKNKMTILQSSFRREKSRMLKSNGNYKSAWFGYKDMCFLLNKDTRETAYKKRIDKTNTDYMPQINEESDVLDDSNLVPKTEILISPTSNNDESRNDEEEMNIDFLNFTNTATPEMDINQLTPVDNSETVSFLNFIGNKMNKYDAQTKIAAQQEICEVMFKLDKFYMIKQNKKNK